MKNNIFEEIKMMQKLMLYDRSKTASENVQLHENIISTPPDAGGGSGGGGGRGGGRGGGSRRTAVAPPKPIPTELKDVEGVKKFQDWLDANKAGWAYGYTDGKVNKGKGYGRYGPRTQAAWSKFKNEFTQSADYNNPFAEYKSVEGEEQITNAPGVEGSDDLSSYTIEVGDTPPAAAPPAAAPPAAAPPAAAPPAAAPPAAAPPAAAPPAAKVGPPTEEEMTNKVEK